ncbi:FAD-dependent oxidoreductase [Aquiflexum sp. TKW24L]|uniref:FAD-dependent oxidoreductase n=1 Tax=Aquiflexum sp. TKW24L TaxID=2942212 RepID=UPI0020BF6FEF|nr:FAD-dependent oxidoreductase [Aquiflexum sp. TKW24L]MCL6261041.1 FAD-dependent oxidoreductase [Aquiflexum sp. TKW24L]
MNRDGARKSAWQQQIKNFSSANNLTEIFDVAIVGGGITGVSTAFNLQKRGKSCILLEASNIGFGTTGGTTAHINDFFETTFDKAISDFGQENAELFKECGSEAVRIIESNVRENNIDCDFEKKTAHLFALDENQVKQLEDIVEGSHKVGHRMRYIDDISYPIPFLKAVEIPNQAQFHPIKYIKALCEIYLNSGGVIVENCVCESHDEKDSLIILTTSKGPVQARNVVYATHIPPGINRLHFMNAPYRSYAMAFTLNHDQYPNELGYDLEDPYHYYRTQYINGEQMLIAGGEDHKTGHAEDTGACFSKLENYVRTYFDVDKVAFSWSSQYFEPVDGFPYIGVLPGSEGKIFTATGFAGNGMTLGSIASRIISDLILTGSSKYEEIFSPARIKPIAGFTDFVKEQATVVVDFVKDKIFAERIGSLAEINGGEAKVIKYEGDNFAIYKETSGRMHLLKSTCPHAKCEVRWNSAEISWDCPCHGSRFNINGKMLTGPSVKGLTPVQEKEITEEDGI